ncbi:TetR family transcriptional regulator [Cellulomonas sp. McL0617]|uniref:TetR/AcrR family transcriptional regulator n=1 Tax=Cellulomonas sp. McL0617 TaxID=3415675 RepID=UPI003CF27368
MRSDEDLTARARIRDAAVARFGRDGFGVGVRAIAADAGVSAALVIHHFGSKDGLRAACDEHVLETVKREKSDAMQDQAPSDVIGRLARIEEYAPLFAYIVRSLLEGGVLAAKFVDGLVADADAYLETGERTGTVRASEDPRGRSRTLVATQVGLIVMAQLDGALGRGTAPTDDPTTAMKELYDATLLAGLELYTHGLFTDSGYLDAYREFKEKS